MHTQSTEESAEMRGTFDEHRASPFPHHVEPFNIGP